MITKFTFIISFVIFCTARIFSQSVNVPLEHWVYNFLDRMQTKALIQQFVPTSRPFSRNDIAQMLKELDSKLSSGEQTLNSAEIAQLEQLKGEFHREFQSAAVLFKSQYKERHLFQWQDQQNHLLGDAFIEQWLDIKSKPQYNPKETISNTSIGGIVRGRLKKHFGFYVSAKNTLIKGTDIIQENFDPSHGAPVTISGDNAYRDDASAYMIWELPWFQLEFGRDRIQWGPGYRGSLMLSANNPRFEMLKIKARIAKFLFTSVHGKLNNNSGSKYLAAHRLEWQALSWRMVSFSELVVYGNRDVELQYINPLMPYHIAEHHLGDKDNNTMGLDITAFPFINHKIYGELLLDDFTTAKNPFKYYGNKFAE